MTPALPRVLTADETRAVAAFVGGRTHGQGSAVELLDDCDRAVRDEWRPIRETWCAAMATDPGGLESLCAAVLAPPECEPPGVGVRRPAEDVRRDLRARRTCGRVFRDEWREDAPVMTLDEDAAHWLRVQAERAAEMTAAYHETCRKARETHPGAGVDPEARGRRFVLAAIDGELAGLAARGNAKGGRKDALYRAAFKVGGLLWAGLADEEMLVGALVAAGLGMGLDERTARRQVARGIRAGRARPREIGNDRKIEVTVTRGGDRVLHEWGQGFRGSRAPSSGARHSASTHLR